MKWLDKKDKRVTGRRKIPSIRLYEQKYLTKTGKMPNKSLLSSFAFARDDKRRPLIFAG